MHFLCAVLEHHIVSDVVFVYQTKTIYMPGKNISPNSTILRQFNKIKSVNDFPMPFWVEMHITNLCNINCYFCNQSKLRKLNPIELPYDKIIETLSELKEMGLTSITLSGGGEPTLHRSFLNIIQYLKANDITLFQIITNGVIADKNIFDAMFSARWRNIGFSLNASDRDDWRLMTEGPLRGFEIILNNIRYVLMEREKRGLSHPRVAVKFGLDVNTSKKIIKAYKLACELGVDDLVITTYNHITYPDYLAADVNTILKQLKDIYAENEATGGVKTIHCYLPDLGADAVLMNEVLDKFSDDNGQPICFMPWYGMLIAASGDVRPCACGMNAFPSMGNVHKEPIRKIWKGRKYQRLRNMFELIYFGKGKKFCKDVRPGLPVFCNPTTDDMQRCPNMIYWNEFLYNYYERFPQ